MQAYRKIAGLALATTVFTMLATGCETGRYNKKHAAADHISDVTTTGHPDPSLAADASGQPPVPGSPTAAGIDGRQPYNDDEARAGLSAEEGKAAAPNRNHAEAFQRQ